MLRYNLYKNEGYEHGYFYMVCCGLGYGPAYTFRISQPQYIFSLEGRERSDVVEIDPDRNIVSFILPYELIGEMFDE